MPAIIPLTLRMLPLAALLAAAGSSARAADDCDVDTTAITTGDFSTSTTPDGWVIGSDAYLTAGVIDDEGSGWLRLTDASGTEVGYAFADSPIDSCSGVVFAFEYTAWGGHGG